MTISGTTNYLFAARQMSSIPVDVMLAMPTFQIEKIERYSSSGNEFVALDFTMNDKVWDMTEGRVVFSPSLNWAVVEYSFRSDYTPTLYEICSGKNTYTSLQKSGVPILEQGEHTERYHRDGKEEPSHKYSVKLISLSFGTVDDSVFLLSHYGLPDEFLTPLSLAANKTTKTRWLLIANGVLLLLIIAWVVFRRFRSPRQ